MEVKIKKKQQLRLTNTPIPLRDKTRLAGAFETAQSVETFSVLTDALQGALVDVFEVQEERCDK